MASAGKSARSREDARAPQGVGATDVATRVLASLGKLDCAPTEFRHPSEDVSYGGVLLALPALMTSGLLRHATRFFTLPPGYYGLEHIFLLLGFLALCRIKSIEALRFTAPDQFIEHGKVGQLRQLHGLTPERAAEMIRERLG